MATERRLLYVGFDKLDVAFRGALPEAVLKELEAAKERAQAQQGPVLMELGPKKQPVQVMQFGRKEGFAFTLDTGPDGELIWVKRSADPQEWNIFVSIKSAALAIVGYAAARERMMARLNGMGAFLMEESINRIDIAADFLAPGFDLDPRNIVAHSRSTVRVYDNGEGRPPWGNDREEDAAVTHYNGRQVSSVTIGKMPGRQVCIYDKRREAVEKRKLYWFDLWGIPSDDPALKVFRVEIRAGKENLKDYGLTTFQDLDQLAGDIVLETMAAVRLLDPADENPNVSRRAEDEFWNEARAALSGDLGRSHVGRSDIRLMKRAEARKLYADQVCGMMASLAVAFGVDEGTPAEIAERVRRLLVANMNSDLEAWEDKKGRARDRLFFVRSNEPWEGCDAGNHSQFAEAARGH